MGQCVDIVDYCGMKVPGWDSRPHTGDRDIALTLESIVYSTHRPVPDDAPLFRPYDPDQLARLMTETHPASESRWLRMAELLREDSGRYISFSLNGGHS